MNKLAIVMLLLAAPAYAKVGKGMKAPAFSVPTLKGDKLALASLTGHVVVLDFWAQWCEPCKKELPELDKLQKELGDKVTIVTVNIDKERGNADKLTSTLGLSLTVGLDPAGAVANTYDLPTMPASYVIDKKGIVRFVHEGFRSGDIEHFKREIDELAK